jgi:stage V sporulation protein R
MQINPYYVGFQILKDIERRWNGDVHADDPEETDWMGRTVERPQGQGLAKLFDVIEQDNDVTFLRQYLSASLVKKLDLYSYKQVEKDGESVWQVVDTDWRKVRDTLVDSMTNFGQPVITVDDGDYNHRGELYLRHAFDGKPLDVDYTRRTLKNIFSLWSRPVHLETKIDDETTVISFDGDTFSEV